MTDSPMTIVHEVDDFVVVDKASGFLSVPGRGPDKNDCVATRIRSRYAGCIEQQIRGFDIPMDNSAGVGIGKRAGRLQTDLGDALKIAAAVRFCR